jgi:hypothetical protein
MFSPAIKLIAAFPGRPKSPIALQRARQGSAGHGTLLFRYLKLGVVERAATPAREPLPAWIDVVPGAVIEACVKQLSRTTARFPGIRAFFSAAATLIIGLLTRFFVSHNLLTFLSVVAFLTRRHITRCSSKFLFIRGASRTFFTCLAIPD